MQDHEKTKDQLIEELNEMRRRVAEFQAAEARLVGTEKALGESEQQLKCILSASPVGILHTRDRRIIWANRSWEKMFGFENEQEYIGQHTSIMHSFELEYERIRSTLHDNVKRGEVSETDALLRRKDGSVFDAHIRISLLDPEDPTRGTISAIADISERKATEIALKESAEKYRLVVEKTHDGILVAQEGILRFNNPGALEIMGYEGGELLSKPFTQFIHPDDKDMVLEAHFRRLKGEEIPSRYSFRIVRKDGETRWVEIDSGMIHWEGNPAALFRITDITERKQAVETIKDSEQMLKTILSISPVGIGLTQDRVMKWVNEAWVRMFGFEDEGEPIGQDARLIYPSEDEYARVGAILYPGLYAGKTTEADVSFKRKDGSVFDGRIRMRAINPSDPSHGTVASISDITERKLAEQERENLRAQLLQSQKMETMGTLAGGIAHDFNNMLAIILGYSSFLLADKNEGDPEFEGLRNIEKTAQIAADLVQRIRLFGRRAEMNPVPMDLNSQIDEVTKLLSHTLPKMIDMEISLAKDPVIISADSAQITQMVMNLAVNAGEAMPQGGRLTIQTENIVLDDDYCRLRMGVKPGQYVMLTVSDTGRGIDKGLIERIFDPFFSTKTRDYHKGTGLGLSVVQGIVQQHGGHITVESEVGRGTTFRMYFPALKPEKIPEDVEKKIPYLAGGNETILLIEDEELVRELGVTILEKFGYTVLSAGDGQEALEVYEKEKGNISLVILDVVMPRMDGKQCFEELLRINPTVKVIISTGLAQNGLVRDIVELGAKGSVNKPYGMRQLLQMVREVLDRD
jgi:PAS domain S-box-containing protein